MSSNLHATRHRIAIIGGGASGTLTCLQLIGGTRGPSQRLDITVVEPASTIGPGVAYATREPMHLMNVPSAMLSAHPDDPDHFVRWRGSHGPDEFAPRGEFGRYLSQQLTAAIAANRDEVTVTHRRSEAVAIDRTNTGLRVTLRDGSPLETDALILATGLPRPSVEWAPRELLDSGMFVENPWSAEALASIEQGRHSTDRDVLLVGSGLTMIDVASSIAARSDCDIHVISSSGRLPRCHGVSCATPVVPDVSEWSDDLPGILLEARRHIRNVESTLGDWRPAVDGLRLRAQELWSRLDDADRLEFMRLHAGGWGRLRHRVPLANAAELDTLVQAGRITVAATTLERVEQRRDGALRVTFANGWSRDVGMVVNCTGPGADVRAAGVPLIDDLLRERAGGALASAEIGGMGLRTHDGRLMGGRDGASDPIWAVGALRRGELWESTAIGEIRDQAVTVARDLLAACAPTLARASA